MVYKRFYALFGQNTYA